MTKIHGNNESSSQHDGNLLFKLMKWTDGLWNKSNRSVSDVVTISMLGEQEMLYNTTYHHVDTLTNGHHGPTSIHSSPTHSHDTHSTNGGSHEEYHLAEYFERAVEMINTVAGVIVLVSVLLVGINLLLVLLNANLGTKYRLFNPMRTAHSHHHHPPSSHCNNTSHKHDSHHHQNDGNNSNNSNNNSSTKGMGTASIDHHNDTTMTTMSSPTSVDHNHIINHNNHSHSNDHEQSSQNLQDHHNHHHSEVPSDLATITRIRLMLGEQTALALGVLVAADVLDTVMKPAHAYEINDVVKMGAMMALRTALAYFLSKEIKELEEEEEKHEEKHSLQQDKAKQQLLKASAGATGATGGGGGGMIGPGGMIHRTYSGMSSRANSVKGSNQGSEKDTSVKGLNIWIPPSPSPHGNGSQFGDIDLRSERSEFDDDATTHNYSMGLGPRYTAPLLDYSVYAQGSGLAPGLGSASGSGLGPGGYHMRRVGSVGSLGHVHPFRQRISPRASQPTTTGQHATTSQIGRTSEPSQKHASRSSSLKGSGNTGQTTTASQETSSMEPSPPYTDSDETAQRPGLEPASGPPSTSRSGLGLGSGPNQGHNHNRKTRHGSLIMPQGQQLPHRNASFSFPHHPLQYHHPNHLYNLGNMGGMPYGMGVPYGPAYFPMPYGHGYPGHGAYAGQDEEEESEHFNEEHSHHSQQHHHLHPEQQPSKHRKQGGSSKRRQHTSAGSGAGANASSGASVIGSDGIGVVEGESGVSTTGLKNDDEGQGLAPTLEPESEVGIAVARQDGGADKR